MTAHAVPTVRIQAEDFDVSAEIARLAQGRGDVGAVVTFSGLCRDEAGTLAALELEHYPGMAEAEIARIAAQAMERWPLTGLTAIHRYGKIRARREHRSGGRRFRAPASRLRRGEFPHGLPEIARSLLEEGTSCRRLGRRMGRCQGDRRGRGGTLESFLISPHHSAARPDDAQGTLKHFESTHDLRKPIFGSWAVRCHGTTAIT